MRVIESHEQAFPPPEVWDAFVAQDVRGHLLQTWAWGELKAAYGWTPVRLAVERDGSLVAVSYTHLVLRRGYMVSVDD